MSVPFSGSNFAALTAVAAPIAGMSLSLTTTTRRNRRATAAYRWPRPASPSCQSQSSLTESLMA